MQIKNLLKKNAVLFAALCITVATSAFKANTVLNDTYTYDGPDFSIPELEDESNWKLSTSPTATNCGEFSQVNCSMELPSGLNNGNQLDATKASVHATAISGYNRVNSVVDPASEDEIEFTPELGREP
ncbi:hypothetical protein ACLOAU_04145 [Niabella sp. CJ426]|uniref:hypothetical protein n=1 Tax=Niabella sp. CJ426 TaxID=3393740 RepID=UPI003CFC0FA5